MRHMLVLCRRVCLYEMETAALFRLPMGRRFSAANIQGLAGIPIPQFIPGVRLEAVCLPGKRYRERYRVRIICPLITVQKEKYGFRVTNVGFNKEANTSLDLLMTCTDYLDYTYDNKGAKMTDLMPIFGISDTDDLWLLFADGLPAQEIKIDIVKAEQVRLYREITASDGWILICTSVLESGCRMVPLGTDMPQKDSVVNVFQTELFPKTMRC